MVVAAQPVTVLVATMYIELIPEGSEVVVYGVALVKELTPLTKYSYEFPPFPVMVILCPWQMILFASFVKIDGIGFAFTVKVRFAVEEHPDALPTTVIKSPFTNVLIE